MSEYLFVLGRAKELCQAEIEAVLARKKVLYERIFSSPEIFHISAFCQIDASYLIRTLGGTIKIAEVVEEVAEKDEKTIVDELNTLIQGSLGTEEKKITFGLSGYSGIHSNDINHWSREIKDRLVGLGLKARFILPTERVALTSVVVTKQKLLEIILVKENDKIILAKTLLVQDFEDWGRRDFGRPAPDPHRGMLPPKVARMMVNLGKWPRPEARPEGRMENENSFKILDPFCGVGTILAEGMMLKMDVAGSDQSQEAVEKTKKNLEWLKNAYQLSHATYHLLTSDATHISQKLPSSSIDAIVTETYLGPVAENGKWKIENRKLENIILGLEKLYFGCFRDWWKILVPGGKIVIALPSFKIGKRESFVKKPIDTCENLGYTLLAGPFQYSRPQAVVIRNIYILRKTSF